jgi:hypothetical protein
MTTDIQAIQTMNSGSCQIVNGSGTNRVQYWQAGASGGICKGMNIASTDTADRIVQIWYDKGAAGTYLLMGSIVVPTGSGTDGVKTSIDAWRSPLMTYLTFDAYGNKVFEAGASDKIWVSVTSTVTSHKNLDFNGPGGNL